VDQLLWQCRESPMTVVAVDNPRILNDFDGMG
jgi:hypothetical protein